MLTLNYLDCGVCIIYLICPNQTFSSKEDSSMCASLLYGDN